MDTHLTGRKSRSSVSSRTPQQQRSFSNRSLFLTLFFAGIVLFVDQTSKYLFNSISVINYGISFGLFQLPSSSFIAYVVLLAGLLLFFWRDGMSHPMPFGLLFWGSISNIVDRALYGGVKDWIHLPFGITNNIADWAIFFGVCILIVQWHHGQRPNAPSSARPDSV